MKSLKELLESSLFPLTAKAISVQANSRNSGICQPESSPHLAGCIWAGAMACWEDVKTGVG